MYYNLTMKKKEFGRKESSLVFLLAFLFAQIALTVWRLVLSFVLSLFKYRNVDNFFNKPYGYCIFSIMQLAVFVGIFIYFYKSTNLKEHISNTKINIKWLLVFILFGIVTMFGLSYFINHFSLVLNLLGKPSSTLPYDLNNWNSYIFSIISLAIFPAVGEELLFRGTILNGLKSKGKLYAIIMSSLMFSIFHFNLSQLFYPILFGMILGITYVLTNNLIVPICIHFVNNALNLTLQFALRNNQVSGISPLYLAIIGAIIYLGILIYLVYLLYKKEKQEILSATSQEIANNHTTIDEIDKSKETSFFQSEKFKFYCPLIFMLILYIILTSLGA